MPTGSVPRIAVADPNPASAPASGRSLDAESQAWLDALDAGGHEQEEAVARLHALLLRAARFEIVRRRPWLTMVSAGEVDDLATQSAGDALMAVLRKRHEFRGESRFTTWAYKFALLEASVKVRRRAWQDREVSLEPEAWDLVPARSLSPEAAVEGGELIAAVQRGIGTRLTAHQRQVLVALAIDGVPVDVLAERLGTTRGALYKTLHDARRKLRAQLACEGFAIRPQSGAEGDVA
ncbi:MAG: sigma-70 family RNA polymerase sigma factor [Solirubrobacteraceae bacterium]